MDIRVSTWAQTRLGSMAGEIPSKLREAVESAHEYALKAHLSAEMDQNDAYGHTLKVKIHQMLEQSLRDLPGVSLRKPSGGRFLLPIIEETSVALLPIRYSKDRQVSREKAKINLSEFRRSLLVLANSDGSHGHQLTIEDAMDENLDVDAHYEQIQELDEQLRAFGQVVTIGFGSNPTTGVWGIGWGDLRVDDQNQIAVWEFWEDLPAVSPSTSISPSTPLLDASTAAPIYFDQTDESEDLGLFPRQRGSRDNSIGEPEASGPKDEASTS